MGGVGAGDSDEVQLAGHVGQPVVLHRAAPLALLDHDERGGLLIDNPAVHLRHIQHQRCLSVAPGNQTAVQQTQAGLLPRSNRLHAAPQAARHHPPPLQQAATTRRLRAKGKGRQQHTHQRLILLTPALTQAMDGRDKAMTQPLKRVLQATPQHLIDDRGVHQPRRRKPTALTQPRQLTQQGSSIIGIETSAGHEQASLGE